MHGIKIAAGPVMRQKTGVFEAMHGEQEMDEVDMRAIVRLLGEVAALPGGLLEKKSSLLDGLCDFVGAGEWRWAVFQAGPGQPEVRCLLALRRRIGERGLPLLPAVEQTLGEIDAAHFPPLAADSHTIISERFLGGQVLSRIALCREPSDRAYSDRERNVARLVLEEIPWLHFREWPRAVLPSALSPRQQLVLDHLLNGLSRKDVADKLHISLGTVSGYCREIYTRLGVNSQSELLRQTRRKTPSSK